jgi:hypothetical protein
MGYGSGSREMRSRYGCAFFFFLFFFLLVKGDCKFLSRWMDWYVFFFYSFRYIFLLFFSFAFLTSLVTFNSFF